MKNDLSTKELIKRIEKVNPDRLEGYIKAFDRMLLYSLACNIVSEEALGKTVEMWKNTIKKSIDADAKNRTSFLESTPDGRKAKMAGEPDGESIRLKFLETMNVAQDIIKSNLIRDEDSDSDSDEDSEDPDINIGS